MNNFIRGSLIYLYVSRSCQAQAQAASRLASPRLASPRLATVLDLNIKLVRFIHSHFISELEISEAGRILGSLPDSVALTALYYSFNWP